MTQTWQRRAAGISGLIALLGVTMLMVLASGTGLGRSLPDVSVSAAAATDHSAFVALPESRPTFAFVETIALLGFALVAIAGLTDLFGAATLLVRADGVIRQRRWRARMVGAPPSAS
ncbi:MAG: hypothetical protein ACXWCM_12220 [Acidimicrobiales bacterium]